MRNLANNGDVLFWFLSPIAIVAFMLFGVVIGSNAQSSPDKKDYALAALEAQRNEAWNREARCQSEAQFMIDDLKKQIADLKKQLGEK